MSVLGAWLAKFAGAMGGAPAAGAILGGGLLIGIVVGGFSGGGGLGGSPAPSIVVSEIYPCPNMGPPLQSINSGQHVYVTGKLADETWLRIHYGSAGLQEAWIPAGAYSVLGSLDDVPVATCNQAAFAAFAPSPAESMTDLGSFEPTAVPTAPPTASPTPAPTATPAPPPTATPRGTPRATAKPPTPPPTPAPTPVDEPPVIVRFTAGLKGCSAIDATAVVTDDKPGETVQLRWTTPSGNKDSAPMSEGDPGFWHGSIVAPPGSLLQDGTWVVSARATDSAGNHTNSQAVNVVVNC